MTNDPNLNPNDPDSVFYNPSNIPKICHIPDIRENTIWFITEDELVVLLKEIYTTGYLVTDLAPTHEPQHQNKHMSIPFVHGRLDIHVDTLGVVWRYNGSQSDSSIEPSADFNTSVDEEYPA